MVDGWKEAHGIDVVNFFGSNEGIALVGGVQDIPDSRARARLFPRFGAEGLDWSNRVSRGMRTELVDPQTGRVVEAEGGAGELRIDGPTLFHGYRRREDLTAKAFDDDGFYRTGDLFQLEDERHLRFVGRARDLDHPRWHEGRPRGGRSPPGTPPEGGRHRRRGDRGREG